MNAFGQLNKKMQIAQAYSYLLMLIDLNLVSVVSLSSIDNLHDSYLFQQPYVHIRYK